jgi:hypothetical protein
MWGTEDDDLRTILVNGLQSRIRRNLFSFLDMYQHDANRELIWIDQLCINQDDEVEKSSQVAMMGGIYRGANETLIWLGCNVEGQLPLATLREQLFDPDTGQVRARSPQEHRAFWRGANGRSALELIKTITSSPYWTRLWVGQEICLSTRPTLATGDQRLDLPCFVSMFEQCERHNRKPVHEFAMGFNALLQLLEYEDLTESGNSNLLFNSVTYFAMRSFCCDPRDKIFGVQALLTDRLQIRPDYTRSICEIYWSAAEHYFRRSCWAERELPINRWYYIQGISQLAAALSTQSQRQSLRGYLSHRICRDRHDEGRDEDYYGTMTWEEMKAHIEAGLRATFRDLSKASLSTG